MADSLCNTTSHGSIDAEVVAVGELLKNADINADAPIFMLPPEILHLIFMFAIPPRELLAPPFKFGAPQSAWNLTIAWLTSTMLVCKQWTNAAIPFLYRRIHLAYPGQMNKLQRSLETKASLVPMVRVLNLPWFVVDSDWIHQYPQLPSQFERLLNMCQNLSGLMMVSNLDVQLGTAERQDSLFGSLRLSSHSLTHLEIGHPFCEGHVFGIIEHFHETLFWLRVHATLRDKDELSSIALPDSILLPQLTYLGLSLTGDLNHAPAPFARLCAAKLSALSIRCNGPYNNMSTNTPVALCWLVQAFGSRLTFLEVHCAPVYHGFLREPEFSIQRLLDYCSQLLSLSCDSHIYGKHSHPKVKHVDIQNRHYYRSRGQCGIESRLDVISSFRRDSIDVGACPNLKLTRVLDSSLLFLDLAFLHRETMNAWYDYPGMQFCVDTQGVHHMNDMNIVKDAGSNGDKDNDSDSSFEPSSKDSDEEPEMSSDESGGNADDSDEESENSLDNEPERNLDDSDEESGKSSDDSELDAHVSDAEVEDVVRRGQLSFISWLV